MMNENNSVFPPAFTPPNHDVAHRGTTLSDNRKRALFVGPKFSTYYYEKFSKIANSNAVSGFNFGAFFFSFIWFFYRKMYWYGSLFLLLILLLGAVCTFLEIRQAIFTLPLSIYIAIYANSIYKNFVDKKIRKIENLKVDDLEKQLIKRGRTSSIAVVSIFLTIAALLYYIFVA